MFLCCSIQIHAKPQTSNSEATIETAHKITISTLRDPVDKSFRKMMSGVAIYVKHKHLAPDSSLRFKLLPRQIDAHIETVRLKVVGDSFTKSIDVASDASFTLEMDEKAMNEDASVRPNRKAGSLTWRALVRTPGLPENVYRLGDLRLSCLVGKESGLISNFAWTPRMLFVSSDFCNDENSNYLFFSEKPLFGVRLEAGARQMDIPVDRLYAGYSLAMFNKENLETCDCQVMIDRTYHLPLGDLSWPNDTLVKIEYMEDGASENHRQTVLVRKHAVLPVN